MVKPTTDYDPQIPVSPELSMLFAPPETESLGLVLGAKWVEILGGKGYSTWVSYTTPEDRMKMILDSLSPKDLEEWQVAIDKRMEEGQ